MCGIVGIVSLTGREIVQGEGVICSMRDALIHRGPDDAGTWISKDRCVALGHRRLAVVDLDPRAHQPMSNVAKNIWLVYNGELYNAPQLRMELQVKGYTFQTAKSDTEVIIHAYEAWGVESVKRFNGMFALALWDVEKKSLWVARDHVGEKPLYYSIVNGNFIFASEIKALFHYPAVSQILNKDALYQYLFFQFVPPPSTFFSNIHKLESGTWLTLYKNGSIVKKKYWDMLASLPVQRGGLFAIGEEIRERLSESVRLRMMSDVSVGVFLSGGLDSSINAALISREPQRKINTFSLGYDDSKYNELSYARAAADSIGSIHSEKIITAEDFFSFIEHIAQNQDEPLGDPVCIPLFHLARHARRNGVTVCHVGEGSDELFFGYPSWRRISRLASFLENTPDFFLKRNTSLLFSYMGRKRYSTLLQRSMKGLPLFWCGSELFSEEEKQNLLSSDFFADVQPLSSFEYIQPFWDNFLSSGIERTIANWMSYIDISLRIPELLMMRLDKMAMASSVEIRAPYLDHNFVSFIMSLPTGVRVGRWGLKTILRSAVGDIVPSMITKRKKQGFPVPIAEWIFSYKPDYIEGLVGGFLEESNYFNTDAVWRLYRKKDVRLWPIINFILWHKRWLE